MIRSVPPSAPINRSYIIKNIYKFLIILYPTYPPPFLYLFCIGFCISMILYHEYIFLRYIPFLYIKYNFFLFYLLLNKQFFFCISQLSIF